MRLVLENKSLQNNISEHVGDIIMYDKRQALHASTYIYSSIKR